MDEDLNRDIGAPLAGDDDDMPQPKPKDEDDDLDDNFDRELREAERDLEEAERHEPDNSKPRDPDEDE